MRDRGARDAPSADIVDHELHRFGLVDGRKRTRTAGKRVGQPARANRFGCDHAILGDRDCGFGDRDHIARSSDAAHRHCDKFREIVTRADEPRANGNRNEARAEGRAACLRSGAADRCGEREGDFSHASVRYDRARSEDLQRSPRVYSDATL